MTQNAPTVTRRGYVKIIINLSTLRHNDNKLTTTVISGSMADLISI